MRLLLTIVYRLIVVVFLTILTQIGGLVFLLSTLFYRRIEAKTSSFFLKNALKLAFFLVLYIFSTFVLVPFIAKPFGRVPLPFTTTNHLKPLNHWTCFLNRNYVRPELKQAAMEVATKMNEQYAGTSLNYLDANFPFLNQFPLLPHLSHNDGKKLDLSFCYLDTKTNEITNDAPSFIGYGICEEPLKNEENAPEICAEKGYSHYNFLRRNIPQGNKKNFIFDAERTKTMVNLFATQANIGRIFIEPHLKNRLNLTSDKIRFHGCQAVRHDDHLHVQLK